MMERGFLADCTDYQGLDEALLKGAQPGYIGFDATAKSLHVGSLIQIMMLLVAKDRQQANHFDGWRHNKSWRPVFSRG